jgi:flagellar biogenesis protein FliO
MISGKSGAVPAPPIPAKQRIEREFRQLETAIARCIYEDVLPSPEIELMNRALYEFMLENPGVTRLLRVNAGGFTINDVSSESARSAPPRSVSGQRWFQHITQGKTPYYSMDIAPDGAITLFYAWPLTAAASGLETTVTGGFAASIDLVSQIALIEDAPPFRILYAGKAVFEHDWDGLDYEEDPLPVKGVKDMTVQTLKPFPTRSGPRAPQASAASDTKAGAASDASKRLSGADTDEEGTEAGAPAPGKKGVKTDGWHINKILTALLILIALMLAYSMLGDKITRSVRAWNDTRYMKAIGRETAASAPTVPDGQPQSPQQPTLPPQPVITKIVSTERAEKTEKMYKEQQKTIAKMAELIRKKIDTMEGRIETLAKKVEELEKGLKK